jgi:hypothetical protein
LILSTPQNPGAATRSPWLCDVFIRILRRLDNWLMVYSLEVFRHFRLKKATVHALGTDALAKV